LVSYILCLVRFFKVKQTKKDVISRIIEMLLGLQMMNILLIYPGILYVVQVESPFFRILKTSHFSATALLVALPYYLELMYAWASIIPVAQIIVIHTSFTSWWLHIMQLTL